MHVASLLGSAWMMGCSLNIRKYSLDKLRLVTEVIFLSVYIYIFNVCNIAEGEVGIRSTSIIVLKSPHQLLCEGTTNKGNVTFDNVAWTCQRNDLARRSLQHGREFICLFPL